MFSRRPKTETLIKTTPGKVGSASQPTSTSNRYTLGSGEKRGVNPGHWQTKSLCLPIINDVFNNLKLTKYYILDLSTPRSKTMQLFQQWPCNYRLFDLHTEVIEPYKDDYLDLQSYREIFNFPHPYDYQLDLIILWDLLSYMSRDNIIHFMDFISNYSHEGTLLYFINSNTQYISKAPSQYTLSTDNIISCTNFSNDKSHPSPRYSTRLLADLMPCFEMYKLSMLQNDTIEHLCIFEEYRKPPKVGLLR